MGKGDKKTRRGKIFNGSYGNMRQKNKKSNKLCESNFNPKTKDARIQSDNMKTVIENLKKLDLSKKPEKEIKEELNKITSLPFVIDTFTSSEEIERAVPNTEEEPIFHTVSRLSYKPHKYNTDFQRASTPANTMFYGSVIPADLSEKEVYNARIIGAAESCDLIRDETKDDGEKLITFGKWRVKEPLNLVAIIDPNKQYKVKYLNKLVNAYKEGLSRMTTTDSKDIKEMLSFICDEFSKRVNQGENYNYMNSAIFTEILVNHSGSKIDGILYPSVQTDGDGLCVAIRPESMHKLELIKVLQCKAVRKGKKVDLDNIRFCDVNPSNSDFKLEDINKPRSPSFPLTRRQLVKRFKCYKLQRSNAEPFTTR